MFCTEKIIQKLTEAGFMISCQKDINLSKEIAGEIYKSKVRSHDNVLLFFSFAWVLNYGRTMLNNYFSTVA